VAWLLLFAYNPADCYYHHFVLTREGGGFFILADQLSIHGLPEGEPNLLIHVAKFGPVKRTACEGNSKFGVEKWGHADARGTETVGKAGEMMLGWDHAYGSK